MYLLFCDRSVLDVVTDALLFTECYYLCSSVVEELLVLRISGNFGIVVHSTKHNSINKVHFLQQHLQVLPNDIRCWKRLNAYPCNAACIV